MCLVTPEAQSSSLVTDHQRCIVFTSRFLSRCTTLSELTITMLNASLSSDLISSIEADDLASFTSFLRPPQSENRTVLNELLAYAIRHNAVATIPHLTSLGASPFSEPAFKLLQLSSGFPAFSCLVANGVLDINSNLDWSGTFLILAVMRRDMEHVSFCLKHGANPNLGMYARMWSALATAAEYDASLEIVEMLLAAGADLEGSDALQTAAARGKVDLVRLFLEKGADIDALGFEYCAMESQADEAGGALHFAVDAGSVEVIRLLLENGADIGLHDVKGRTARQRAEEKAIKDVEKVIDEFCT